MIRESIKSELSRRKMSVLRLANETGIRPATLTLYLNQGRGIYSENLEKVLIHLDLKIAP